MDLPRVLAGPILRRTERARVCVWLATSTPERVDVEVSNPAGGRSHPVALGSGIAATVKLGPRLFVHLAQAVPHEDAFPADELLAYDLRIGDDGAASGLADLGLVGADGIAYAGFALPTFFIRQRTAGLNLLHGSCRLLHGKGDDALARGDQVVRDHVHDLQQRPSILLLTGDQIYGDEVAGPLIGHLTALGAALLGPGDETSVPGLPPLSTIPVYGRQQLAEEHCRFTSGKAGNHLLSFGEFAAMYLLAWNEALWPAGFPPARQAIPAGAGDRRQAAKLRRQYTQEYAALQRARAALPAVRRLLANAATYMVFDDHDVTDDWNLSAAWQKAVHDSPAGRRVVANALAAFWAFQGWGNEPELFDDAFRSAVGDCLAGAGGDGDRYDSTLWGFDRWSYHVPTQPPTIMLDTRTRRRFDSAHGAARLLDDGERRRVAELCRAAGHQPGDPLILVSAVPIFGLELQERRQKFLVGKMGPYEIDFEAWHSNLHGLLDLMRLLADDLELVTCTVLSGDVHYGLNVVATFHADQRRVRFVQLISSSQKHSGTLSKAGLAVLGRLVGAGHARVGWQRPPPVGDASGVAGRLLRRAPNTDEWDSDSPVFVAPGVAARLDAATRPQYREYRRYVRPRPGTSVVVGANNVGWVTWREGDVTHRLLLADRGGRARTRTATFRQVPGKR